MQMKPPPGMSITSSCDASSSASVPAKKRWSVSGLLRDGDFGLSVARHGDKAAKRLAVGFGSGGITSARLRKCGD